MFRPRHRRPCPSCAIRWRDGVLSLQPDRKTCFEQWHERRQYLAKPRCMPAEIFERGEEQIIEEEIALPARSHWRFWNSYPELLEASRALEPRLSGAGQGCLLGGQFPVIAYADNPKNRRVLPHFWCPPQRQVGDGSAGLTEGCCRAAVRQGLNDRRRPVQLSGGDRA